MKLKIKIFKYLLLVINISVLIPVAIPVLVAVSVDWLQSRSQLQSCSWQNPSPSHFYQSQSWSGSRLKSHPSQSLYTMTKSSFKQNDRNFKIFFVSMLCYNQKYDYAVQTILSGLQIVISNIIQQFNINRYCFHALVVQIYYISPQLFLLELKFVEQRMYFLLSC